MATPSKRIYIVIKEKETPVVSNKKRERYKDIEKEKEKQKDQVPLEQEKTVFEQGIQDEDLQIIKVIENKESSKKLKGRRLEFA